MTEFVLKNDIVEFNGEAGVGGRGGGVKRQKSGTAIGTKYTSFYADNFMDEVETEL